MSHGAFSRAGLLLACAVAGAACHASARPIAAAPATCTTTAPPKPSEKALEEAKEKRFVGKMPIVRPSTMGAELRAIGLDPKNLPPLELVERPKLLAVMQTFTKALGVGCTDCHREEDFHAETPRRRVARHMWDEMVRVLAAEDGSPVYCDSCHQGKLFVLDRKDKSALASYMDEVMVGKLKRADGKDHDCGTCHGDPPDFEFLDDWRRP